MDGGAWVPPNAEESREAPPNCTVSLTSQRHSEKLPEVAGTSQGNPGFYAETRQDLGYLLSTFHINSQPRKLTFPKAPVTGRAKDGHEEVLPPCGHFPQLQL